MRWFRLAAEQGHPDAQHNLAIGYANGRGVPPDATEAMEWFQRAADQGHVVAQYNLAIGYANGLGVTQNATAAAQWYRIASNLGYGAAGDNLPAVEATMTADQIAEARRLARAWLRTLQP